MDAERWRELFWWKEPEEEEDDDDRVAIGGPEDVLED